jgi:hypothetical protein
MNTPKQNKKKRASRVVTPKSENVIDIASSDEDVVLLPSPPKKIRWPQKAVIDLTKRLKVKTEAISWKHKTENSVIDLTEEQSASKNFNPNRQLSQDGLKSEKLDKSDGPVASIPDREVSSSTTLTSIQSDEMETHDGLVSSIPDREVSSSATSTIKSDEMETPDGLVPSIPDREVSSTSRTSVKSDASQRPGGDATSMIPDQEACSSTLPNSTRSDGSANPDVPVSSSVPPVIVKSDDFSTSSDGPVSSNETVAEVLATAEQDSGPTPEQDSGPTPDGPVSSNETVAEVLATAEQDIRIKKEGDATVLPEEEREQRRLCLEKWIQANRDPKTDTGRFVFRRGCAKHCITQILGGSGVDPWPLVKKPPENDFTGSPNQFIEANHFYAAGCESFNPFGPRFPGDKGLLNLAAFESEVQADVGIVQEEFHFFVECSDREHARHWHGPDAKGGRMVRSYFVNLYCLGLCNVLIRFSTILFYSTSVYIARHIQMMK